MQLNDSFWRHFELDLQEIKLAYLNWAIGYAREPKPEHRHMFLWDHQEAFCIINSRYGRSFSISPFGIGVRGVPRIKPKGIPRGLDEIDIALKARLTASTGHLRTAIANALETGNMDNAGTQAHLCDHHAHGPCQSGLCATSARTQFDCHYGGPILSLVSR